MSRTAAAAAAVEPELDAVSLLVMPLALLGGGVAVLYLFTNVLRLVAAMSTKQWAMGKGELGAAVQPVAGFLKYYLELAIGPISNIKVGLDHIVLCAILIALVGMWRTNSRMVAAIQAKRFGAVRPEESDGASRSKKGHSE